MGRIVVLLALACGLAGAWTPPTSPVASGARRFPRSLAPSAAAARARGGAVLRLAGDEGDDAAPPPPPPSSLDKLRAEASNPFRTVRVFLYGSFALSATIGGFTALTQTAASVGAQPDALPLSQCLTNVAIDFRWVGLAWPPPPPAWKKRGRAARIETPPSRDGHSSVHAFASHHTRRGVADTTGGQRHATHTERGVCGATGLAVFRRDSVVAASAAGYFFENKARVLFSPRLPRS